MRPFPIVLPRIHNDGKDGATRAFDFQGDMAVFMGGKVNVFGMCTCRTCKGRLAIHIQVNVFDDGIVRKHKAVVSFHRIQAARGQFLALSCPLQRLEPYG